MGISLLRFRDADSGVVATQTVTVTTERNSGEKRRGFKAEPRGTHCLRPFKEKEMRKEVEKQVQLTGRPGSLLLRGGPASTHQTWLRSQER